MYSISSLLSSFSPSEGISAQIPLHVFQRCLREYFIARQQVAVAAKYYFSLKVWEVLLLFQKKSPSGSDFGLISYNMFQICCLWGHEAQVQPPTYLNKAWRSITGSSDFLPRPESELSF